MGSGLKLSLGQKNLLNQFEGLKGINNSKDIAELLNQISIFSEIELTERQKIQFSEKVFCNNSGNYRRLQCFGCNTTSYMKTPCNSFFCKDCRDYLTSRIKRNAKQKMWNCNHFMAVFTIPNEVQEKLKSWDDYIIKNKKKRNGQVIPTTVRSMSLIYDAVSKTIDIYSKKNNFLAGYYLLPHTYGSLEMNWKPHINVLISSKALKVFPDAFIKKYNKFKKLAFTIKKTHFEEIYNLFYDISLKNKLESQSIEDHEYFFNKEYYQSKFYLELKKEWYLIENKLIENCKDFQDFLVYEETPPLDIQFNFDEIRSIYHKQLEKLFEVKFYKNPQVSFSKDKKTKSIYIPYKKAVGKVMDYFRRIPLYRENILKTTAGFIVYQTSKAKKQNKTFKLTYKEFFDRIIQHLPPANFRTARSYGLYANNNKLRNAYPKKQMGEKNACTCKKCKQELTKDNLTCIVTHGRLVWINPSILDCKDFDFKNQLDFTQIMPDGRLIECCAPPDCLKPTETLQFPEKEEYLFN